MTEWETDEENGTGADEDLSLTTRGRPGSGSSSVNSKRSPRRSLTPKAMESSQSVFSTDRTDKRASDETMSILDPRRFTPTLHANLVSEILALRRDQEEKTRQIETLEVALHSVKGEHEVAQGNLTSVSKENRSLQRQLSLLEGGTVSALKELVRERDEAVDLGTEMRKRLEIAHSKIRKQDEDSQREHGLWARDKDSWEDERRKYERKLHVAESRIKMVLEEVAAYQTHHAIDAAHAATSRDDEQDEREADKGNDLVSVRTMSLTESIRHSLFSGPILQAGNSLADELDFDEDDHTEAGGRDSVLSHQASPHHGRTMSREDVSGRRHWKNHSMESLRQANGHGTRSRLFMNPSVLEALEGEDEKADAEEVKPLYQDTGTQCSPPPSPRTARSKTVTPDIVAQRTKTPEPDSPVRADTEIEANQRRKRVQIARPLIIELSKPDHKMVTASAQTISMEMPLSPPKTPQSSASLSPVRNYEPVSLSMVMAATQTEDVPSLLPSPDRSKNASIVATTAKLTPFSPPLEIPSISIQPPTSRPTTPQEPRLPQHFKHFGCQVNIPPTTVLTRDACVQTEGIQVDRRLALLPPHLQPSAISSRPNSPNASKPASDDGNPPAPRHIPPRNPRRRMQGRDSSELPLSPVTPRGVDGENDVELAEERPRSLRDGTRRINRHVSSMFAEFDTVSSDGDSFADLDFSDSEYRTALSAPRPRSASTRVAKVGPLGTVVTSLEQGKPRTVVIKSSKKHNWNEIAGIFKPSEKDDHAQGYDSKLSRTYEKAPTTTPPMAMSTSDRISVVHKAALVQRSLATRRGRSRSPSLPEGRLPPFPIPTRASSRRPQAGVNAYSDGWESPTGGETGHHRGPGRLSYQSQGIRKVRSAAALPWASRYRRYGSRSPPPLSASTEGPESPNFPPLPQNIITTPHNGKDRGPSNYRRHQHELSTNTDNTNGTTNTAPTTSTGGPQTVGVVDAIAQTMVGEWMLKYVRRRKSFNVPDSSGKDDSSNDRHKRWVWLAPYERSILWSSKQPASGNALMGKTGRKLTIQSVLDVKDENPAPKTMPSVFSRSILILTPQRALKFTSNSAERHYVWLTALSFLAHSSQDVPEIISAPQLTAQMHPLPKFETSQPKLKRGGIRDSIRLAKSKTQGFKNGSPSIPSMSISQRIEASGRRAADPTVARPGEQSREQLREAAEAPFIPRFLDRSSHGVASSHGRKRSNTGGHVLPPLSFRGFSGPAASSGNGGYGPNDSDLGTINDSVDITASDMNYTLASTKTAWNSSRPPSQRTSEGSAKPGNFFDAIGTVRMEAFISPLAYSQDYECSDKSEEVRRSARRRSKDIRRRYSRNRQGESYKFGAGRAGDEFHRRTRFGIEEDYFARDDPFKGF